MPNGNSWESINYFRTKQDKKYKASFRRFHGMRYQYRPSRASFKTATLAMKYGKKVAARYLAIFGKLK